MSDQLRERNLLAEGLSNEERINNLTASVVEAHSKLDAVVEAYGIGDVPTAAPLATRIALLGYAYHDMKQERAAAVTLLHALLKAHSIASIPKERIDEFLADLTKDGQDGAEVRDAEANSEGGDS